MSDDLIQKLRDVAAATVPNDAAQITWDAADRIAELEAQLAAAAPDPIGAEWMRQQAASVAANACLVPPDGGNPTEAERIVCDVAHNYILAIPGPSDDDLDRAALARPKVAALVEAAQNLHDYGCCLADQKYHRAMGAAIADLKGGAK